MRKPEVVLYSSGIAAIMVALIAWLSVYSADPQSASVNELLQIQTELNQYAATEAADQPAAPVPIDTVMAWWYPGAPACAAVTEAANYQLEVVKPEYFIVKEGGQLELMTTTAYGCNGYSEANVATARSLAPQQFVTVSASYAPALDIFLQRDEATGVYVEQLVEFVMEAEFTGVELDFEDFGGWTPEIYGRYKAFVTRLGEQLHQQGKQLMLDLPAVRNEVEEEWYQFRLTELEVLPVDYLVIMAYDYQYDHGAGEPVTPLEWLGQVVEFTAARMQADEKIVIGLPSYGYLADATGQMQVKTETEAQAYTLYDQALRDTSSQELIAQGERQTLVYQDSESMKAKMAVVAAHGIGKISIWHLGGNPWFE